MQKLHEEEKLQATWKEVMRWWNSFDKTVTVEEVDGDGTYTTTVVTCKAVYTTQRSRAAEPVTVEKK